MHAVISQGAQQVQTHVSIAPTFCGHLLPAVPLGAIAEHERLQFCNGFCVMRKNGLAQAEEHVLFWWYSSIENGFGRLSRGKARASGHVTLVSATWRGVAHYDAVKTGKLKLGCVEAQDFEVYLAHDVVVGWMCAVRLSVGVA